MINSVVFKEEVDRVLKQSMRSRWVKFWNLVASMTEGDKELMILMAKHMVSVNQSDLTQRAKQVVQTK